MSRKRCRERNFSFHFLPFNSLALHALLFPFAVFVSSKSYIYITPPNNESKIKFNDFDTSELPSSSSSLLLSEPIYENIENFEGTDGGVVASADDNNKCTIYVNYDFIKGEKSSKNNRNKSSVRLLEPDVNVKLVHMNEDHYFCGNEDERQNSSETYDDNDEENNNNNNGKSMSKMIQCQQISMYIGEKKNIAVTLIPHRLLMIN